MDKFLDAIPAVARSPLALVASIALLIAAFGLRFYSTSQKAK
jgi:hypothetical protein